MAPKKGKQKVEEAVGPPPSPALDEIPVPITTFDLSDIDKLAANYEKCVSDIRDAMKKDTDVTYTFVMDGEKLIIPVTPGKDHMRNEAYVIQLTHGNKSLYLVADKYQTWFRGIVTDKGLRFEIDKLEPKRMKRSQSLHTDGMYPDLVDELANLRIGYQQLISAFYTLARYKEDGIEKRCFKKEEESIAILVVMLFEGPRLLPIFEMVKMALTEKIDMEVGKENKDLINDWCDISKDFYYEKGDESEVVISAETSDKVRKAAQTLRIMCRSQWDRWVVKKSGKQGGQAQASSKHGSKQSRGQSSSSSKRDKHGGGK